MQRNKAIAQGIIATGLTTTTFCSSYIVKALAIGAISTNPITGAVVLTTGACIGAASLVAWNRTIASGRAWNRMRAGPSSLIDEVYEGKQLCAAELIIKGRKKQTNAGQKNKHWTLKAPTHVTFYNYFMIQRYLRRSRAVQ